ncbi:MAG: hypothetical protein BWZ09_02555 [Alphaproteobacteria bacterium ADurb.BinA305]|nr:MAG: hypothetical protein BWZ09_02555 [Alphaproteobacteria bacterium ADurb.BinA305]
MAVLADLLDRRRLAEAGHIGVLPRLGVAAPSVVGAGDLLDVFEGQLAMHAVDE